MAMIGNSTQERATAHQQILETIARLRSFTQRSCQQTWHFSLAPHSIASLAETQDWQHWPITPLNTRNHIPWDRGGQPIWLCQEIVVPETLNGFAIAGLSLRLALTWWAEAVEVYVDGMLVQEGDLFDYFARILLSDRITPGQPFLVAIHMVSPGHDDGALVRSDLVYESADGDCPEPGFIADEMAVLQTYAEKLAPEKLDTMAAAIAPLNWTTVSQPQAFQAELTALRARLLPLSDWIKQRQITCVGHAHLDLAWLWPVEETWRAAERTFRSVLSLQADFPELTYTHSSPALFDWLETHKPELFQPIQEAVQQGAWSIDAGLWVEPELNVIGGESLVRQILYGQRYARSRFGKVSAIAWLPDSFGFSWQLPQLLRLGQINTFATQKLRWNETTQFPHSLFRWQGLDGTQILSLTLPPIGTDIDPAQMATHSADWEHQTGIPEMLWLPGMGDHGGGPTRDMLEKARRWATSPFFPELQFDSVEVHLDRLANHCEVKTAAASPEGVAELPSASPTAGQLQASESSLPVWNNELYLELHRGCYTVHADQKWFNRRCEDALRDAELFATLAYSRTQAPYPKAKLETAWKQALFNQFHDILPGTAIPEVCSTANQTWQSAYETAKEIRQEALGAIAHALPLPPPPSPQAIPIILFNSLNWERTEVVEIDLRRLPVEAETWGVFDAVQQDWRVSQLSHHCQPKEIPPCQPPLKDERTIAKGHLLCAIAVPSMGYRMVWLVPNPTQRQASSGLVSKFPNTGELSVSDFPDGNPAAIQPYCLENETLQAIVDSETGELTQLREKPRQQNIFSAPANQLQAFRDAGQYWDAWDIAPDYESHPLPAAELKSIHWLEAGSLRQRLRVIRTIADSTIQQDYVLDQPAASLKVETIANWQATQVVLKTAFPLSIESDLATYEIPFGAIARPTQSTDLHEQMKWEVPAYRWADLSDREQGLSILTDYKHGFDAKPNHLRLTLLKAPLWPDPQADRGRHAFTYGLYPHSGDWRTAKTPNQAISFNTPFQWAIGNLDNCQPTAPAQAALLHIDHDSSHLAALKLAEDQPDRYVLRFWEMYGEATRLPINAAPFERTDLLEAAIATDTPTHLAPWEIATLTGAGLPDTEKGNATQY